MKKIIYIGMLLLIGCYTAVYAQNRNVVWVHGLGDNSTAWQYYEGIFTQERQINSARQSYSTSSGLSTAASQLNTSVQSQYGADATNSRNIGIGHSMGGLMIREVDRTTTSATKKFGGYITVVSPNYGAPIANSLLNGSVHSAVTTALNRLTAGPVSEVFGLPWLIISGWTTSEVANLLLDNDIINKHLNSTTTGDLQNGSTAITTLNNFNSTAHRISIVAQESSPVHWRLLGSAKDGNDQSLVGKMNQIREIYSASYNRHQNLGLVNAFLNPPASVYHYAMAAEWKKGRDWMDNSETVWCSLIKTSRVEPYHYWSWVWVPSETPPPFDEPMDPPTPELPPYPNPEGYGRWVYMEHSGYATVNYPSDGFLPTYTQELIGISANSENRYTIDYANHLELLNMSNSKRPDGTPNDGTGNRLREIFNRQDWFGTSRR